MPEYGDTRVCIDCNETKPIKSFALKGKGYREACCEPCRYLRRMSTPTRKRAARLAVYNRMTERRYAEVGFSLAQYDSMLAEQGGVCAICRGSQTHGGGRFCIDHDHETGVVRGLLCHHCNKALSYFKDDYQALLRAAVYVLAAGSAMIGTDDEG